MINNISSKQNELNDFTQLLKLEIEIHGYAVCELSDGSYRKVIYREADTEEDCDAAFRTLEWTFLWNLDGSSITSNDFNIVGFEPRPLTLNSAGVDFRVKKANLLQAKIDSLYNQIDELIDPVAKLVADTSDPSIIRQMVDKLPGGFHRSELRTLANTLEAATHTFGPESK